MTATEFEALLKELIPSAYDFKKDPDLKELCSFKLKETLMAIHLNEIKARNFSLTAINNEIIISLFSELLTE